MHHWVSLLVPALFVLLVLLALGWLAWQLNRAGELVEKWAARNRLTIVSREQRTASRRRFPLGAAVGEDTYAMTVQDAAGRTRSGVVRVAGRTVDSVVMTWDT